ncbi:13939_t:CDS:2 [Rhizophagus irregularis]|nr:13939_t:CDS:2 [Rhizophagus irregularis]
MFPRGEDMWYPNIPKCNNESTYTYNNKDVSKFSDENELLNTSDKKNKHDLPHAYLLFILAQEYKPKTIDDYNTIISAKIPDENSNSNIFNTVKRSIIDPVSTGTSSNNNKKL